MPPRFRIPPGYLRRFVAGAVFGLYISHLLYYLNPQIEISGTALALITAGYGLYCGVLFGTLLWGLRLLRRKLVPPEEFRPHGFGIITFAAFFSAFVYWGHLVTLRIYLPSAAVWDLSRATLVIGVAAFILLLMWLFERTASKRVSQVIFAIGCSVLALSVVLLHQRRESLRIPESEQEVVTVAPGEGLGPIVVVTIPHLPHDWIVELRAETPLPFFHDSSDDFFARIEPFPTTSRRAIWASLVTGKLPYRHGVTGHYAWMTPLNREGEPYLLLPNGVGFSNWGVLRPARRQFAPSPAGHALPLWGIFERTGLRSAVIGWPGLSSAPEADTSTPQGRPDQPHPGASQLHFAALGPAAADALRLIDADRASVARAVSLLDQGAPALTIVRLDGIGDLQEHLGLADNALPPVDSAVGDALRTYIEQIGLELREFRESLGSGVLFVVSPSALHPHYTPDDIWTYFRSRLQPHEGDADGFLLMTGNRVVTAPGGETLGLTDLVPTVLFAGGLPIARDMDGRVITSAFDRAYLTASPLGLISTWEARRIVVTRPSSSPADDH
jgi:hypothetical protein